MFPFTSRTAPVSQPRVQRGPPPPAVNTTQNAGLPSYSASAPDSSPASPPARRPSTLPQHPLSTVLPASSHNHNLPLIMTSGKRMSVHIHQGVGPLLPPFGPDGLGKPRYMKVHRKSGKVKGWLEVGDMKGVSGLEIVVTGTTTTTIVMRSQYSFLEPTQILKKIIPLPMTPTSQDPNYQNQDPNDTRIGRPPISDSCFAFEFEWPKLCGVDVREKTGGFITYDCIGGRVVDRSNSTLDRGRRDSQHNYENGDGKDNDSDGEHSGEKTGAARSPDSSSRIPRFLSGSSRAESSASASRTRLPSADPAAIEGKRYELPPSSVIVLNDVNGEVKYNVKFKVIRKGWKLNDVIGANCIYSPEVTIPISEPHVRNAYPGWNRVILSGGEGRSSDKGKGKATVEPCIPAQDKVEVDVLLPTPLVMIIPSASASSTDIPPSIPFRLHFSSTLPYPLQTFASTETSLWSICLIRVVSIKTHREVETRTAVLQGTWELTSHPQERFGMTMRGASMHIRARSPSERALSIDGLIRRRNSGASGGGAPLVASPAAAPNPLALGMRRHSTFSPPMFPSALRPPLFEEETDFFGSMDGASGPDSLLTPSLSPVSTRHHDAMSVISATSSAVNSTGAAPPPRNSERYQRSDSIVDPMTLLGVDQQTESVEPQDDAPPPEFSSSYTTSMPILPPAPLPTFEAATGASPDNTSALEHVYVDGIFSLAPQAYKMILSPFVTKEMSVRYFLEIEIIPKTGAVSENFTPVKGRREAIVVPQQSRAAGPTSEHGSSGMTSSIPQVDLGLAAYSFHS